MGPPDKPRGRPAKAASRDDAHGGSIEDSVTVGYLRRRREAAWRLPVLASGYRDPLNALAGLPHRRSEPCCRAVLTAAGTWGPCCRGAA